MGGQSGTDLINLPDSGTILDQSNLFVQTYVIYKQEYNEFLFNKKKNETDR
jgi:hypothetical protein